jgi:hypothetical protein
MLVIEGLSINPIRLLVKGIPFLKVKQLVLPSKMTLEQLKKMPPTTVKQVVLL